MKILITGGCGFIGRKLSKKYLENNHKVVCVDNLSSQIHKDKYNDPLIKDKNYQFIRADITKRNTWKNLLDDIDIIVHLASETGTGQSMYQISQYADVNIMGTAKLLEAVSSNSMNIKKIIFSSSRAIYGEGKYLCKNHGVIYPDQRDVEDMKNKFFENRCPLCNKEIDPSPTDENSKVNPQSIYAVTKYTQEQMILTLCKSLDISCVSLRYQNVYGPGQSLSNPYTGILSIFSTRMLNSKNINIFEDGNESRDFVYVDDVVDATYNSSFLEEPKFNIINIGSGISISVNEVAKMLKDALSSSSQIKISGNFRLGDIRHNFADISKAKKLLNFQPKYSFQSGLKYFADWVKRQPIYEDLYEKSIEELKSKGLYK